jgi:hypothetical protein
MVQLTERFVNVMLAGKAQKVLDAKNKLSLCVSFGGISIFSCVVVQIELVLTSIGPSVRPFLRRH